MNNRYLKHYGVKGMHWGVWNAETRARYAEGKSIRKTPEDQGYEKVYSSRNAQKRSNS